MIAFAASHPSAAVAEAGTEAPHPTPSSSIYKMTTQVNAYTSLDVCADEDVMMKPGNDDALRAVQQANANNEYHTFPAATELTIMGEDTSDPNYVMVQRTIGEGDYGCVPKSDLQAVR